MYENNMLSSLKGKNVGFYEGIPLLQKIHSKRPTDKIILYSVFFLCSVFKTFIIRVNASRCVCVK